MVIVNKVRQIDVIVIKVIDEQQSISLIDLRKQLVKYSLTMINNAITSFKIKGLISIEDNIIKRTTLPYKIQ